MDKIIPTVEGPEEGLFLRKHFLLEIILFYKKEKYTTNVYKVLQT